MGSSVPGLLLVVASWMVSQPAAKGIYYRDIQAYLTQHPRGVEILGYESNSTVERLGLRARDVVVAINRKPVRTMEEFRSTLFGSPDPIQTIEVIRDGRSAIIQVPAKPSGGPSSGFGDLVNPWLSGANAVGNLGPRTVLPEIGAAVQFEPSGMRIRRLLPDSTLPAMGIQAGDLITSVNNRPLRSAAEFENLLFRSASHASTLTVFRQADGRYFSVEVRRQLVAARADVVAGGGQTGVPINPWVEWIAGLNRPAAVGQETSIRELGVVAVVEHDGLRILDVDNRSLARELGLQRGDLLSTFNGARVLSQGQFRNAVFGSSNAYIEIVGVRRNRRFVCAIRREPDRLVAAQRVRD